MGFQHVEFPDIRVIHGDTALEYAAWHGVLDDLRYVERMVERIGPLLASPPPDRAGQDAQDMLRAMSSSSLVAYARCFEDGARRRITPTIFDSRADDAARWHEYFMESRHKHIAHPLNVFDDVRAYCTLEANGDVRMVNRVVLTRAADSEEGVRMLGVLTRHAIEFVEKTLAPLQATLETEVRAMTPEQRLSLPPWKVAATLGDRPDVKAVARRKAKARTGKQRR
jgi:hypothetical protein